ncbi:MAG: hypothetical protein MJZ57_09295 [Bacteroidales bacterium]|nr:hypothetical protein [Bacteroidales bacterium]
MKNTRLYTLLILLSLIWLVNPCTAQKRNSHKSNSATDKILLKGDSCISRKLYFEAQNFYFEAKKSKNLNRSTTEKINQKILLCKKYLHFESMMRNARQLENAQSFSGALKYYEDAFQYAQDEHLDITDTTHTRTETIQQLVSIYDLLDKSKAAEKQNDFEKTQKYFLDAIEKADLVSKNLEKEGFSASIGAKLDSLVQFMVYKNDTILNYKEWYPEHYDTIYHDIWNKLSQYLETVHSMPDYAIRFISTIDSAGITRTALSNNYVHSKAIIEDSLVLHNLQIIAQNIQLLQPRMHGFPMSAIAEFYVEFGEKAFFVNVHKKQDIYKMKMATRVKNHQGKRFRKKLDEEKMLADGEFTDTSTLQKMVKIMMDDLPDGKYKYRVSCIKMGSTEAWKLHVLNSKKH